MPLGSVPLVVSRATSPGSAPDTPPLIVVQRPFEMAPTSIEPLRSAPSMSSMLTVRLAMSEVVTAEAAMRLPVTDEMARSLVLSPPSAILVVPSVSSRMSLLVSEPLEMSMPVSDELATSSPVSELLAMSAPASEPSRTSLARDRAGREVGGGQPPVGERVVAHVRGVDHVVGDLRRGHAVVGQVGGLDLPVDDVGAEHGVGRIGGPGAERDGESEERADVRERESSEQPADHDWSPSRWVGYEVAPPTPE